MFKAEVQVVNDSKWYSNSLEFETRSEAVEYARDLLQRWTQSVDWRVIEFENVKADNHRLSQKQQSQLTSYSN
jgi:hypothetical protein